MYTTSSFLVAALALTTQAFEWPISVVKRQTNSTCPAVWNEISTELTGMFLAGGECTDAARAVIRGVFHDCFPDGGCDGSLLFPDEFNRPENAPMAPTMQKLADMAAQKGVGRADILMFAGSHAVATCPGGPIVKTMIGRTDATAPCPQGQLPPPNIAGDDALAQFQARGFSAQDLAALIGAHTASKQASNGQAQDTTPGIWDILYYVQTIAGIAPTTFPSDTNLVKQGSVGPFMKQFSTDKSAFDAAFVSAMERMELLGVADPAALVDCTKALPQTQAKARRDHRKPLFFRSRK